MQSKYMHSVPAGKDKEGKELRINITFRRCHPRPPKKEQNVNVPLSAVPVASSSDPKGGGKGYNRYTRSQPVHGAAMPASAEPVDATESTGAAERTTNDGKKANKINVG